MRITNDWSVCAGLYSGLPNCLARTVTVPSPNKVNAPLDTVAGPLTNWKITGNPALLVPLSVMGALPKT